KNIGSAPSVLVDPATVPAGAGGQEIALEEPLAEGPQSLSEVRALLGPDAFAAAERQLRSYLADHPESGAAPVLLAEALRRQGKLEEALPLAELGVERLPNAGRAYWIHSRILAQRMERVVASGGAMAKLQAMKWVGPYRDALRTAIVLDPGNIEARREEVLFHMYTPGIGDPKEGLALAEQMVPIHPMHGELTVARALYFGGEVEPGLEKARLAIARFPESSEPAWIYASLLYEAKRYEEADKVLASVMARPERDETYYQALYRRMRVRTTQQTEPERVLTYVEEYLQANPQWEWAPPAYRVWCEKGRALAQLGRKDEARAAFEQSLALEPTFERARDGLQSL
ncbi:MAG: tetratricopeptide repeat protein, partial [Planctomycetes bacterium]|nr:tetratricopeptide repeat protein [Planctomycetota bacterium]